MRVQLLFLLMLPPGVSGCGLLLDLDPPDLAAADGGPVHGPDAVVVTPDADQIESGMVDAGPPDVDAGSDAGMDAGPPDSGPPDAGPSPIGCADGTVEQPYPGGDIVGCDGAVDQCEAVMLCGAGWHLCGYGEYAARGGGVVTPTTIRWIASCVRGNAPDCTVLASPTNAICGSCSRTPSSSVVLGRRCDMTGPLTDTDCPLGAVAFGEGPTISLLAESSCLHVTVSSTIGRYGATCCR